MDHRDLSRSQSRYLAQRRTVAPLLWWVFSAGAPIYAVRTLAEARKLALAWHHGLVVRVSISRTRHRSRVDALAALAAGDVREVG